MLKGTATDFSNPAATRRIVEFASQRQIDVISTLALIVWADGELTAKQFANLCARSRPPVVSGLSDQNKNALVATKAFCVHAALSHQHPVSMGNGRSLCAVLQGIGETDHHRLTAHAVLHGAGPKLRPIGVSRPVKDVLV